MGWEGEERHSVAISASKINDGTGAPQKGHRVLCAKKNKETFVDPHLYLPHRLRIPEHREGNYLAHMLGKA